MMKFCSCGKANNSSNNSDYSRTKRHDSETYDVETAYLNGDLSHEVYKKQPEGYQEGGHKIVCKLQKNLYGLKQGANEWNRKFNDILITNGFKRSENDPYLYSSQENGEWMYISIHVDDLIVAATKDYMFKEFEKRMGHTLNIKNLWKL